MTAFDSFTLEEMMDRRASQAFWAMETVASALRDAAQSDDSQKRQDVVGLASALLFLARVAVRADKKAEQAKDAGAKNVQIRFPAQVEDEYRPWREWAYDERDVSEDVARLRRVIANAMMRLLRVGSEQWDVNHAREILERALNEGDACDRF